MPNNQASKLSPNPRNPRNISAKKLAALAASYAEFGDLSGLIFNRRTGLIISGHQRQKTLPDNAPIHIAKSFDEPDALGTVAFGWVEFGADRIPYREVDWPIAKADAAMIAANHHGGEDDRTKLSEILNSLEKEEFDLDLTGIFGDALAQAKLEAYDSLSKVEAIVDAAKRKEAAVGADEASDHAAVEKTERVSTIIAVTLTAIEAQRWTAIKKAIGTTDDKAAILNLFTKFYD